MRKDLASRLDKLEAAANPAKRFMFIPYEVTARGKEEVARWQEDFLREVPSATTVIFFQWRGPEPCPSVPGGLDGTPPH